VVLSFARLKVGVFLFGWAMGCAPSPPAGPPNILLIVVDTLRADHVGLYGHERETTPNLDRLAADGSFFRRAYAQSSWTLPSMTSLLTGLLPHQHGVGRDPDASLRFGRLAPEIPTVAEQLLAAGYATGAIVNNVFLAPEFGLQRGFGEDYDYRGASKASIRSAEESVDAALVWLQPSRHPFFLLLHFMEPHLFYDPAPEVRGTFTGDEQAPIPVPFGSDRAIRVLRKHRPEPESEELEYLKKLYDEEILAVDRAMGRLFEELEKRADWENTVVIVTADHGEEFFDHGGFEHGHTLYGELTRVPLVVHGPGLDLGEIAGVVEHVDLSRGILGLAGVPSDKGLGGDDLFSTMRRGEMPEPGSSISENTLYGPPRLSYLDGDYRMHLLPEQKRVEIWELNADGLEARRLASPELNQEIERMKAALAARRGDLSTGVVAEGPELSEKELSQLMALGYLKEE
jgi:arylsulfatase A-like enzyme